MTWDTAVLLPWEREKADCSDEALLQAGRSVILSEAAELTRAAERLGLELAQAAKFLLSLG